MIIKALGISVPGSDFMFHSITFYQELITRRREYPTVKLSPESNVKIQLRFDALMCCMFANIIQASVNSSHVTFWILRWFDTLFSLLRTLDSTYV